MVQRNSELRYLPLSHPSRLEVVNHFVVRRTVIIAKVSHKAEILVSEQYIASRDSEPKIKRKMQFSLSRYNDNERITCRGTKYNKLRVSSSFARALPVSPPPTRFNAVIINM